MTKPLSPAAQAVLDAAGASEPGIYATIAAALRAAADQVVPEDLHECASFTNEAIRLNLQYVRQKLLTLATELEGVDSHP
jgi:hypothetical protein